MTPVILLIGAGSIGQAIARRVNAGKHVLLADLRQQHADADAKVLSDAGFDVSTATVDVASRKSVQLKNDDGRRRTASLPFRNRGFAHNWEGRRPHRPDVAATDGPFSTG